jgi:hypothetical protein
MTSRNTKVYKLGDFDKIKAEGFSYTLPAETIAMIKFISEQVGAPEYIKTPHFEKRQQGHGQHGQHGQQGHGQQGHGQTNKGALRFDIGKAEDWDSIRKFQATKLEKKQGVELSINKIRKHLNKLTDKTYANLKEQIIEEIEGLITATQADEELSQELNKIGEVLFEIASGNGFYSHMYATLYKDLMNKYEFMEQIFLTNFNLASGIFKDFAYCDPNKDYDQFCRNNKTNEKRRSLSLFYVNLMLQGIIPVEKIANLIEELQSNLCHSIKKDSTTNIVEELSETIFILVTNSVSKLRTLESEWTRIVRQVNQISLMKPKSEPSISNKTIFKHMDLQAMI